MSVLMELSVKLGNGLETTFNMYIRLDSLIYIENFGNYHIEITDSLIRNEKSNVRFSYMRLSPLINFFPEFSEK